VTSSPLAPDSRHVAALDGLRGIAALVVVIRHTTNAVPMPELWRTEIYKSVPPVFSSQGAVQLFFVLSGWVLAASLARGSSGVLAWLPFWVRRICRIHLPFVAAALAAFALSRFWSIPDPDAVTRWLSRSVIHPSFGELLGSLTFPGKAADLIPVGWTLTVEMIYSFALPLLVLIARPLRGTLLLGLGIAGLLAPLSPLSSVWYGLDFALGVVAFQERALIDRALRWLPAAARAALPLLGLALISAPVWLGTKPGALLGVGRTEILSISLGAIVLVVSALSFPVLARMLGSRPCVFLGSISYSVYLLHRPLLTFLAPLVLVPTVLASKLVVVKGVTTESAFALLACMLVGTILLSVVFRRLAEQPAMALGRRASRALEARLGLGRRSDRTGARREPSGSAAPRPLAPPDASFSESAPCDLVVRLAEAATPALPRDEREHGRESR
jgi:peptidoglycan/LPS O-acetylase OafA/YrhL